MTISCKNCTHKYKGNFCHNCGQKARTHDINFQFVLHEVPHSAFHVDKGIFFTIKELSTRPAKTIQEFIDGKRIKHFPPLTYVILMGTLYVFIKGLQLYFGFSEIEVKNEALSKHRLHLFLALIPSYAFVFWIFNKKFGINFWQHIVAQTFMTGHFILMLIIPNTIFFCFPETRNNVKEASIVISFLYFIYVYYQLYKPLAKNKIILFFRVIVTFTIATLFAFAIPTLILIYFFSTKPL